MNGEITQELLNELFTYSDGRLYRKVRTAQSTRVGDLAGGSHPLGYRTVGVNGKNRYEHRLIFLLHHGYLPEFIDHIDGNKSNNQIENLRAATKSENMRNRGAQSNNALGLKGVCFHKQTGRYKAEIKLHGKRTHLGLFDTPVEASAAYAEAANNIHGIYANAGGENVHRT